MELAKQSKENGQKTPIPDADREASEIARLTDEVQRLLKENEQRNAELAIISSVQQGLASKLKFQSIIELVGDQVYAITKAKSISIALYDKTSGMISWPYWLTLGKRIEISDRPMEKSITRQVMYADKPLNLGTEEEILAHDAIPPQMGWTVGKSYLGVPFTVSDVMLGALSLHDFDQEHAFDESDERLLQTLANSMSLALENARLFAETEQRATELQIINSVQEGLASKLDIQAIYDLVGDKIRELFHNTDTEIRVYDPKTDLFHVPYSIENGQRVSVDPISLSDARMSAHVLRTGQTLVINENFAQELEKYGAKMVLGRMHHPKSGIFVPLMVGNQARGLIILSNVEREHAFSESDVRLFQTLANSMSTALENARLFDETQRLLKETEQRAAELAIINSVQEGLASKLEVQAIYDLVGDKIRHIFHAQGTAIYLFDHKTEHLDTPYCYLKKRFEIESRPFSEHPIAKLMVNTFQPITYHTVEEYRALGGAILENSEEYKSGMYVPLMVGKELKGMVGIANLDKENAYNDSDLRLLQTLANSLSVALENARLFDETQGLLNETQQRNAELAIINSVQAGLAEGLASKRDLQAIYDLVGDKIRELFPNTDTEIRIYDPEKNLFRVPYYIENGQRVEVEPISPSDARMSALVLRTGRTLVVNENIFQEMEKYGAKMMHGRRVPAKSMVFVPLLVGDQARGLIVLNNVEREHAFRDSDVRLLQTLANSMSTALENVRLFDEVQKKNAEITEALERETASNDILRVIAESPTDIQPILEVIARNAAQLSGSDDTIITLREGDTLRVRVDAHYGDVPTFPVGEGMRFNRDSVAGRAIIEGHTQQAIHKQPGEESEFPEGDKWAHKYGYRMTCAVPLLREGKAIGAISIRRIKPELLTEKQIALIQSFANQAAIAVENVRLFNETTRLLRETEQRAAELAIINSVQEGLASKLDMQAIYDLVGDKIRDLLHAQSVWIIMFDPATRTRRVRYSFENGQRYYTSELFPYNKLTEHLITTKKPLVINQNFTEAIAQFEMVNMAGTQEQIKSIVYIPIIAGEEVKGFISLPNIERENAFSESDVNLLSTFASSMSIALENIRLFDETRRLLKETEQRAAELVIINDVQAGLASRLDMQAIYDLVGDKIRELFNAQSILIVTYDLAAQTYQVKYNFEKGKRYYSSEWLPFSKLTEHMMATKKALVINQDAAARTAELGMTTNPGTEPMKSGVFVPVLAGEDVKGLISVQNVEQENAFSESDVSLLSTFASSMSITLENIRLFDETQRLLKETEQRAAELAIINSVQEGLSSKLDMQAIYELVGDKMQEIFDAQSLLIVTFDHVNELAHMTYNWEKGIRYYSEPYPFTGLHRYLIESRNTVVINENALESRAKFGMIVVPGTEAPKSMIFVPLTSGYRVSGMISIQNLEREHAFSETDVRLLETLAASISVALENASLFDETQRLFLEAKDARTAAEQANQAKSAFLSSMSHELRTPLNAIINFVEMVARGMIGPVNQEQVELLDQALDSSKHLLNLINDVLDISKIQAGQLTLFIEDQVSVQVEVEAALSIAGGLLQEKGLQLVRDIDPHLPLVSCDRRRLRQVLLNLISNAIKFTSEGTVTVSVKDQGQEVLFAVIDTGPGIPSDKRDLIFEPFIQAENGERQLHGTGLGLPISRSLVRAHGGELWVDSERGEGSAFFFTLPVNGRNTP